MSRKTKRLKLQRKTRASAHFTKSNTDIIKVFIGLILSGIRLPFVGFINLCFRITPTPNMIAWAYVLWAGIGAGIAWWFYDKSVGLLSTYLLMGMTVGGMLGTIISLWKGIRHNKRGGNPYFPS